MKLNQKTLLENSINLLITNFDQELVGTQKTEFFVSFERQKLVPSMAWKIYYGKCQCGEANVGETIKRYCNALVRTKQSNS